MQQYLNNNLYDNLKQLAFVHNWTIDTHKQPEKAERIIKQARANNYWIDWLKGVNIATIRKKY